MNNEIDLRVSDHSAPEPAQEVSFSDIPDLGMNEEMKRIKQERDSMPQDSLDYLVDTCLLKEKINPDLRIQILNEFYKRFYNLPGNQTQCFPKLFNLLREQRSARFPSLTMAEIKRMIHPLNIWELSSLLNKVKETLPSSFRKNLVLVVGATAAGKSTFIQSCLGYSHCQVRDDKKRKCLMVEGGLRTQHITLLTSRANESCTLMINTYEIKSNYIEPGNFIGDTAGLGENRGAQIEIANTVCLESVMCEAASVRFVFLINHRNWGDRGNSIRQYLAEFSSKFKDFSQIKNKIVYVLNGFSEDNLAEINADLKEIEGTRATQQYGERGHRNLKEMISSLVTLTEQLNDYQEGTPIYDPRLIIFKPKSTTSKEILKKLGVENTKIQNIAENVQLNFSTNCSNVIREEVEKLSKRAQSAINKQIYSKAVYYMKLLKDLSQNIRKDQFTILDIEQVHKSFLQSQDQASVAWKKIMEDVQEKAKRRGQKLIDDFKDLQQMSDSQKRLQEMKQQYESYKEIVTFITELQPSYQSSIDQVNNELKESENQLLQKFKNNPSKAASMFLQTYSKAFNSQFLTEMKKALKQEFQQQISDLENSIQDQEFEKLDSIFIRVKKINEQLVGIETQYQEHVQKFEEELQRVEKQFQMFIQDKVNTRTKLKEQQFFQNLQKYCQVLKNKMKSKQMKEIFVPIFQKLVENFCISLKKTLGEILGSKTVKNQRKIMIAWNNYTDLKEIDNTEIKSMLCDIKNEMEKFEDIFQEKYQKAPSKRRKNFQLSKIIEDLVFIATRIKMYNDIGNYDYSSDWKKYFGNALKKIEFYHDDLKKQRQAIENDGNHNVQRINQIYKTLEEIDDSLEELQAKTQNEEKNLVQNLIDQVQESQKDVNEAIMKNVVPDLQRIINQENQLDVVMKMKKMSIKVEGMKKIISDFQDQETKRSLLEKRKQAEEWIYRSNQECLKKILQTIGQWKDAEQISSQSVTSVLKGYQNLKKQTNFSLIRDTMRKKDWEPESEEQKIFDELTLAAKLLQIKANEMIDRNQIAEVKNLLEGWKHYQRKVDEAFPNLQVNRVYARINEKIRTAMEQQFQNNEFQVPSERLDLDLLEEQLTKAEKFSEQDRIKKIKGEIIQFLNNKVVIISQKLSILEGIKLSKEKQFEQVIEEMIVVNQETIKFDQIVRSTYESKKYLQKMKKLNEKLEKIVFEGWCEPISHLIKEKLYIEALQHLKKYKAIESYLMQGKQIFMFERFQLFVYDQYSEIADRYKREEEDRLVTEDETKINWNQYGKGIRDEYIVKLSKQAQQIQDSFSYSSTISNEVEKKIDNLLIKVNNLPKEEVKDLKQKSRSMKETLRAQKKSNLQRLKEHKNDLSWLIRKIKDSKLEVQIQKESIDLFETEILSRLKSSLLPNFNTVSHYLEEEIMPIIREIRNFGVQVEMSSSIRKIEDTINSNIRRKIVEEMRKVELGTKQEQKQIFGFLDNLKQFYLWAEDKNEVFSQQFFQQIAVDFQHVFNLLEKTQKIIDDSHEGGSSENYMFQVQIYRKIQEILKFSSQYSLIASFLNKYNIDTKDTEQKLKNKTTEIEEALLILENFTISKIDFQKMSKKNKQEQLEKVMNAYLLFKNDPLIHDGNGGSPTKAKKKMPEQINRITQQIQEEINETKKFISHRLNDLSFAVPERVGMILQIVDIMKRKRYPFLQNSLKNAEEIQSEIQNKYMKVNSEWEALEKQIAKKGGQYLTRKKELDSAAELQKLEISNSLFAKKNSELERFEKEQSMQLKDKDDQVQIQQIVNKFKGYIKSMEIQNEKEKNQLHKKSQEKYLKEQQLLTRPLQEQINQFVENCLLQQKMFYELQMQMRKKQFRGKMEDFGKRNKKRILQMVFQAAERSTFKKYSKIFLEQNLLFEGDNHAVWQKKTEHFTIGEVVKNLSGLKVSQLMSAKIYDSFQNYTEEFSIWTDKYKQNPSIQEIRTLVESIKRDGKNLYNCYFVGQKMGKGIPERLLGKIFALMAIQKAQNNDQDCVVSFEYKPHPAQITAVLLLLSIVDDFNTERIQNAMAQIETGEGKSVVLGGLSAYLSVCGFTVFCACYSSYLSKRDEGDFDELFKQLGIKDKIKYGTFQDLADSKLSETRQKIEELLTSSEDQTKLWKKFTNWIKGRWEMSKIQTTNASVLLIDQIDVFFDEAYFGNIYRSAISITGPLVVKFLSQAWDKRSEIGNLPQFSNLIQRYVNLAKVLKEEVLNEVQFEIDEFDYKGYSKKYAIIQNQIQYRVKDGYNPNISEGLRTMVAYLEQNKRGNISPQVIQRMLEISLVVAEFSYAELPNFFTHILGVTGTLKQMSSFKNSQLERRYNVKRKFYIPSVYGDSSKRRDCKRKIVPIVQHLDEIAKQVLKVHATGRPVLVFFKSQAELMTFFISNRLSSVEREVQILDETFDSHERNKKIRDTGYENQITLMTDSFGRGTDFKISDKAAELGGLHVIQTYLSEELSDQIQIQGRTARQSAKGTYLCLITPSDLELFELSGKQDGDQISEQLLQRSRLKLEKKKEIPIKDKVDRAAQNHKETIAFFNSDLNMEKLLKKIQQLNSFQSNSQDRISRIVLGIDGTCSMSVALAHVLNILRQSLTNLKKLLKETKAKKSFEMKIVIYRNYNSSSQKIIECTKFQRKVQALQDFLTNIRVDGGWGNEALEMLYDNVNNSSNVKDLIILGDAAANTKQETDYKRTNKQYSHGSHKNTKLVYAHSELEKIRQRGIKVHSFYIRTVNEFQKVRSYFTNVSQETKGIAEEFDINSKDASAHLANFMVERIIESTAQNKMEADERKKLYKMRYVKRS